MTIFRCEVWKMFLRCLLLSTAFLLASCDSGQAVNAEDSLLKSPTQIEKNVLSIDVNLLVGTAKTALDAKFGNPDCPPKNACVYGDSFEIFYVDGLAANLTLPPVDDLNVYGLKLGEPEFENPEVGLIRWRTAINGKAAEVSKFENYVYVKTAEP